MRAWAIRWSEPWLAEPGHPLVAAALRLMDDPSWTVRHQLAASIGELPRAARAQPALALLQRYGRDAITVDAVVSGLAGMEAEVLDRLLDGAGNADAAEGTAMLAGALARSRNAAALPSLLDQAGTTTRPPWQRTALLRGVEAGLSPGNAPGRRDRARPPPRREAGRAPPRSRARLQTRDIGRWPRRSRLVSNGRASRRARAPLTAASPPKPGGLCGGAVALRAPMAAATKTGPSLGSDLSATRQACHRIVLSGKEGEIGLMPPLAALDDAEVSRPS